MSALALAAQPVSMDDWTIMREQAAMLVKTGFLPKAVDTPEKAVAIMMKGRELNVPPMHALSQIAVIQGKPTASAELMLALIYRDHGDNAVQITRSDSTTCVAQYQRRGWAQPREFSFTLDEARTANLLTKDMWKAYPQAMLRARCISALARMAFADSIGGMYTPEEMGADVDADGQVIDRPLRFTPRRERPEPPRWIEHEPAALAAVADDDTPPAEPPIPESKPASKRNLSVLQARLSELAAEASAIGLAVPPLPTDEAGILKAGAELKASIAAAREAGLAEAYQACVGVGIEIDEDDKPDVGQDAAYYTGAAELWRRMAKDAGADKPF